MLQSIRWLSDHRKLREMREMIRIFGTKIQDIIEQVKIKLVSLEHILKSSICVIQGLFVLYLKILFFYISAILTSCISEIKHFWILVYMQKYHYYNLFYYPLNFRSLYSDGPVFQFHLSYSKTI